MTFGGSGDSHVLFAPMQLGTRVGRGACHRPPHRWRSHNDLTRNGVITGHIWSLRCLWLFPWGRQNFMIPQFHLYWSGLRSLTAVFSLRGRRGRWHVTFFQPVMVHHRIGKRIDECAKAEWEADSGEHVESKDKLVHLRRSPHAGWRWRGVMLPPTSHKPTRRQRSQPRTATGRQRRKAIRGKR